MVLEAKKFIGDSLTCPSRVLHLPGMCHMLLVYCSIDYINLCKGCVPKKLLKETLVHLSSSTLHSTTTLLQDIENFHNVRLQERLQIPCSICIFVVFEKNFGGHPTLNFVQ